MILFSKYFKNFLYASFNRTLAVGDTFFFFLNHIYPKIHVWPDVLLEYFIPFGC